VAVLMLADEGRLSIDDPVSKYLPEFADVKVYVSEVAGKIQTEPLRRALGARPAAPQRRHSLHGTGSASGIASRC